VPAGLGDANIRLTALRTRDARPASSAFSVYVLGKPVVDLLGQRMNDDPTALDRDRLRLAFLAAAPRVCWSPMSFLYQPAQNAGLFLAEFHEPHVALRLCQRVFQLDLIPQSFTQGRNQRLYR
jgi:hypothetical protein